MCCVADIDIHLLSMCVCTYQDSAHTGRVGSGPTTTNYRMTTASCIPTSLPIFCLDIQQQLCPLPFHAAADY